MNTITSGEAKTLILGLIKDGEIVLDQTILSLRNDQRKALLKWAEELGDLGWNDSWTRYLGLNNLWRWTRIANNGEIVGASTQGYRDITNMEANAKRNGWKGVWHHG